MTEKAERGVGQRSLYAEFMAKLNSGGGLTVAEFEEKRHPCVFPGETLEAFVTDLVDRLAIKLEDGRLVWNKEWEEARGTYDLAKAEALAGSIAARRELKLLEVHDSHL